MEKIASFTVNHLDLIPGVYVSRKDYVGQEVLTTFDLRMCAPNREPVMNTAELHTIEHLAATYLRNDPEWKDKVIYFGPMGCRTGCYLILSGDQICKQDYSDFLRFHKEKGAEFSVAVMEVPWEEAPRFGLMVTDDNDKITEFQEKPKNPKSNLASMGIYIFNWDVLKKYLIEDEADPESENDFGNNIIPNLLKDGRDMYAYHFSGYWKDVGTISSLWEANM